MVENNLLALVVRDHQPHVREKADETLVGDATTGLSLVTGETDLEARSLFPEGQRSAHEAVSLILQPMPGIVTNLDLSEGRGSLGQHNEASSPRTEPTGVGEHNAMELESDQEKELELGLVVEETTNNGDSSPPREASVEADEGPQGGAAAALPPLPPPVGCFVDGAGAVQPLPCFHLVPIMHTNRNAHSYYAVAHGLDLKTGKPFNGILSIWEQSKLYHHGFKGRGTAQFAMPTLIAAQCKLFDVLFAGPGVDGSGFYAAVGGLGGGQPPTTLTEGTSARRKTRARDQRSSSTGMGNGARNAA